jgi:hypothetical protein
LFGIILQTIVILEHTGSPKPSEGRTFRAVFARPMITNHQLLTKICKHQYRNPVYITRQWKNDLAVGKYVLRADLSRKIGVSRAKVTQILNLLKLPTDIIDKAYAMGDPCLKHW